MAIDRKTLAIGAAACLAVFVLLHKRSSEFRDIDHDTAVLTTQ